jgi:hypothetical protein
MHLHLHVRPLDYGRSAGSTDNSPGRARHSVSAVVVDRHALIRTRRQAEKGKWRRTGRSALPSDRWNGRRRKQDCHWARGKPH